MFRLSTLVVTLLLSLPAVAGDKLIAVTPAQRAALKIVSAPVSSDVEALTVGLPAQVSVPPAQERVVAAPVAGLVTEVRVAMGDAVRAGQVLAILRSEELAGAQRDIVQAAVQARLATETAQRDEALYKEGIISQSRLQASRGALEQARAMLNERRAWLRLMGMSKSAIQAAEKGERLADSVALVAPITGVLMEQTAVTGARVGAASALFKVVKMDPLWLDIQAPADVAAMVKIGQKVSVPGTGSTGTVLAVGQNVSAAQTVPIRARVNNGNGLLRLNQSVSVKLEGVEGAKQWHVPVKAIVRQGGQSWVFVERQGGFEPEAVKVLSQSAQSVAIDAPFTGKEKVAIEGVVALKAIWQGTGE